MEGSHHLVPHPKAVSHLSTVYIHRSGKPIIVVTRHYNGGPGGFQVEDESPTVIDNPSDPLALGTVILDALKATTARPARNYRDRKLTDWPAFRSSGARSVRRFEEEFIRLQIHGANAANATYIIEGWPKKDAKLRVTTAVNISPGAIGTECLEVWRACLHRAV